MISSAATISLTRAQAHALVDRAERATGSRMAAYEQVAQTVGTSAGWIRKFIKGYEAKEPRATLYENIRASYEAYCNRVELENEADELRLQSLRSRNAATQSMVSKDQGEGSAGG
jgi:hypothetical protein